MKAVLLARAIVVAFASLAALPAPVGAEEPNAAEIDAMREALANPQALELFRDLETLRN